MPRPSLLLVTDLGYPAQGRRYGDEDVWLSGPAARALRRRPVLAAGRRRADGPLRPRPGAQQRPGAALPEAYDAFRDAVAARGTRLVNPARAAGATCRASGYLVDLCAARRAGDPDGRAARGPRPAAAADRYVVKPVLGADSHGAAGARPRRLDGVDLDGRARPAVRRPRARGVVRLRRPRPSPTRVRTVATATAAGSSRRTPPPRPTSPSPSASSTGTPSTSASSGSTRCRTRDGELLLVELEDLNPYLSLDLLAPDVRDAFVDRAGRRPATRRSTASPAAARVGPDGTVRRRREHSREQQASSSPGPTAGSGWPPPSSWPGSATT